MIQAFITVLAAPTSGEAMRLNEPSAIATSAIANRRHDEANDVIVVTAQPRAANSRPAAIAITTIPAPQLERTHIQSILDLARAAPGFQSRMGAITSSVQISIRGIGAASNTAIEPSVATFVDGIYMPRTGSAIAAFLDLAQAEVLRGPQGTLFGRNASAGALSLFTVPPQPDATAQVSHEIGSGNRVKVTGIVNFPLTDEVTVRVAGLSQLFDGYWHNRYDGQRYGGKNETAVRGSLKLTRAPIEWVIRADHARASGDSFVPFDFDSTSVSSEQIDRLRTILEGHFPDTNLNDNTVNQVVNARLSDKQWGISSRLQIALGLSQVLIVSGYRQWLNSQLDGDNAQMPASLLSRESSYKSRSMSQEIQFLSPRRQWLASRLDLVAGLYIFRENFHIGENLYIGKDYCRFFVTLFITKNSPCTSAHFAPNGAPDTDQRFQQTTTSLAMYGQANFYLTNRISLSIGGRWTRDTKRGIYNQSVDNTLAETLRAVEIVNLPRLYSHNLSTTWRLNYGITDRSILFGGYSTGYKSGGYNSGGSNVPLSSFDENGTLIATRRVFRPERTTDLHIGFKVSSSSGTSLGSFILYRMVVSGYQDRSVLGTTFLLGNSGDLRQQGIEIEGRYGISDRFGISGSLSRLASRFLSFPSAPGLPGLGGTQSLTGKRARFSPKWSAGFEAHWRDKVGNTGITWELSANTAFVTKQYLGSATDANPQTIEPTYALLGARLSLEGAGRRWSFSLFGDNLTDQRYAHFNANQVFDGALGLRNGIFAGSTAIRKVAGNPRTFGMTTTFYLGARLHH